MIGQKQKILCKLYPDIQTAPQTLSVIVFDKSVNIIVDIILIYNGHTHSVQQFTTNCQSPTQHQLNLREADI